MEIKPLIESGFAEFKKLFIEYYRELDCEEDPQEVLENVLLPDYKAQLFSIAQIFVGGTPVGFVIYQTDDVINDWCFSEGWGDVREIYVAPDHRRKGYGRALLDFACAELKANGATDIYTLPVEESESFFNKCGFIDNGDYCADADNKVFELKE